MAKKGIPMLNIWMTVILTFIISCFFLLIFNIFANKFNQLEMNYKKKLIPIGTGIIIPVTLLFLNPLIHSNDAHWHHYIVISFVVGIAGFIDDRYGSKSVKGIKGHYLFLIHNKRITTGVAKGLLTMLLGLYFVSRIHNSILLLLFSTITFGLWTNIFNLLDVRPGRAIKGFWGMFIIVFLLHFEHMFLPEGLILLLTVVLFFVDITERGMLGDAGSNIIGGIVAYWIIMFASNLELVLYFLIGVYLTAYAEKKSFSKWIENHSIVRSIDQWGRM